MEVDMRRLGQNLIDLAEVVIAGNRNKRDLRSLQLLRRDIRLFAHALQDQRLEQSGLRLRVGF